VGDGLWAANMTPEAALRERGLQVLRFQAVYKAVFENRTVKHFLRAVPGLDQFAMLGKAWWHTTERSPGTDQPRYDLVVLDAPATGHALTMLRLPLSILESTPEGPLTRDARKVWNLLRDPLQTAVVLVTLAEDMPANEAIELGRALGGDLGLPLAQLVINALYPSRFCADRVAGAALLRLLASERRDGDGAQPPEAQPSDAALGPVLSRARMAANRRALNERYLRRLARELPLPQILLPYLFVADFALSQVEKLSNLLLDQVTATPLAEGQHE
jgi:anion-transporting  ArsA/GET3 family ATPase